jgi:hypothetical protein
MWVRELHSSQIHAMAERFNRNRVSTDLSDRQEWLYDALVSELEFRHRNAGRGEQRCACYLCIPPFED